MSWIKRHDLLVFFLLAFILAWLPLLFRLLNPESAAMLPWSPLIAALIVLGLTQGRAGVKALLKDMARWRVNWKWYAFALLVPLAVPAAATYLNVLMGTPAPTAADFAGWPSIFPTFLVITLINGPLTEEPGWRGFALPRFLKKYSPLVSSLILGLIWFSWHLPLLLTNDSGGQRVPVPYFFMTIALSVTFTGLYLGTKGSVLLVILMHGANNTFAAFFSRMAGADYTRFFWLFASLWWVVALIVIFRLSAYPILRREVELPTPT